MKRKITALAWLIGAVISYGHAYHNQTQYVIRFDGRHREADSIEKGAVALVASALWPLYWSQSAWEKK